MKDQDDIRRIVENGILIDGLMGRNYGEELIRSLLASHFTAGNWTANWPGDSRHGDFLSTMLLMESFRWIVGRIPEQALIVETGEDIVNAKASGKFGIVMGFQGAESLRHEFHALSIFWRLGLRILGITYNTRNLLGDGCLEPENRGLTHFGIEIVRDCNRLGIVVDLSHAGEQTSLDAIEVSAKPCIFSHSNPAATYPNPRNITNDQMRAVAGQGGVVCLAAWSGFVGDTRDGKHPTRDEYIRQIEYAIDLIGIDHVGIGSDIYVGQVHAAHWDNTTKRRYPEQCGGMTADRHNIKGYEDYSAMIEVGKDLLEMGYSLDEVQKVLGQNLHRVFKEVFPSLV